MRDLGPFRIPPVEELGELPRHEGVHISHVLQSGLGGGVLAHHAEPLVGQCGEGGELGHPRSERTPEDVLGQPVVIAARLRGAVALDEPALFRGLGSNEEISTEVASDLL
jgi:hypothetical protein